jgi:hypothetical protein
MPENQPCHVRIPVMSHTDELARALDFLKELGIKFRGPYSTSKGEILVIEDKILMLFEVLELFSKCQLNRDGIRERCRVKV